MEPTTHAYHHALSVWLEFQNQTQAYLINQRVALEQPEEPMVMLERVLPFLPLAERVPSAIGLFIQASSTWCPVKARTFREEFLPSPCSRVAELLDMAAAGQLPIPVQLAITLEEFPSRIWLRAQARPSLRHLAAAAIQAARATVTLIKRHEEDLDLVDLTRTGICSKQIPNIFDLVALAPAERHAQRTAVLDHLVHQAETGKFTPTKPNLLAQSVWASSATPNIDARLDPLRAQAERACHERTASGQLKHVHDAESLGRLFVRLGQRAPAYRCARALGRRAWRAGWQHQVVSQNIHTRIRKILVARHGDSSAWLSDPTLACSSMSLPLWLIDPTPRVAQLRALFLRAAECPWIFPRLHFIFQWHLACAAESTALAEIQKLAPELAIPELPCTDKTK